MFPESIQKESSSKALAVAPVDDQDGSKGSNSDDMSDQGKGTGELASIPAPVCDPLPRLGIKVLLPKRFTGRGKDLKPEAFDR